MDQRNELKQKLRLEEERREELNRIQQEKLFAEARLEAERDQILDTDNSSSNYSSRTRQPEPPVKTSSSSFGIDFESLRLEQLAETYPVLQSRGYFSSNDAKQPCVAFENVFLVYKMKTTKFDTIKRHMQAMGSFEAANSYFKRLALLLHPDKNSHPLAEQVFKKVKEAFDEAKASLKKQPQMYK